MPRPPRADLSGPSPSEGPPAEHASWASVKARRGAVTPPAEAEEAVWGVLHVIRARGRLRKAVRVVVQGVPAKATKKAVTAALEEAGYAARFDDGSGIPWANHQVEPQTRWPAVLEAAGRVEEVQWEELTGPQAGRRITLQLSPTEYSTVRLAATAAGDTLSGWCKRTLLEATAPLTTTPSPATPSAAPPATKTSKAKP